MQSLLLHGLVYTLHEVIRAGLIWLTGIHLECSSPASWSTFWDWNSMRRLDDFSYCSLQPAGKSPASFNRWASIKAVIAAQENHWSNTVHSLQYADINAECEQDYTAKCLYDCHYYFYFLSLEADTLKAV